MKVGVIVFPGSNCDHDAWYAINQNLGGPNLGGKAEFIWHQSADLGGVDLRRVEVLTVVEDGAVHRGAGREYRRNADSARPVP